MFSRILRRWRRKKDEACFREYIQRRAEIITGLVNSGWKPVDMFSMPPHSETVQFGRLGDDDINVFWSSYNELGPMTNIANLWWRRPTNLIDVTPTRLQ